MNARTEDAADAPPTLPETIELQRLGCELAGSPLYAEVLAAVASEVGGDGPCARLLGPYAAAPFGDAVVLRFLAAVHLLVLAGDAPELARHYGSTGGSPGNDLTTAFVTTVAAHESVIETRMTWGVQTNEVGRSVVLLGGFQEAARTGLPLRILEVGASAGLNLRFDQFRYRSGPADLGPETSAVVFDEPWLGGARPPLSRLAEVVERRGCDLDPIDPGTDAGRLRLRSLVWPDQPERRHRLDQAIEVAVRHPVVIDQADAVEWLAVHLADPVPGMTTVVAHSIVLQYLPGPTRRALIELLDQAGERATRDAPLAWVRMEPGGERAETRITQWPGGRTRLLSTSGYHGPPVAWVDGSISPR